MQIQYFRLYKNHNKKQEKDYYHLSQSIERCAKQTRNSGKVLCCVFYFKCFHLYEIMVTQLGDLFQPTMSTNTDSQYESCQT
jgi:hypothetical protein